MKECFIVTGVNGDIGDSIGRILQEEFPKSKVIGVDCESSGPASSVFESFYVLPKASDESYFTELLQLSDKMNSTCIIPTSEPELLFFAQNIHLLRKLPILMNDSSLIITCFDKWDTISLLKKSEINVPITIKLEDAKIDFLPFITKPRRGAGGKGVEIVKSEQRLKYLQDEMADYVAQELLLPVNEEYTCALFRQDETKVLIMHRTLQSGVTKKFTVSNNDKINAMLLDLADKIDLRGSINIQLKLTDKGPRIFEINPRFSSTVMMRHRIGFSDLLWSVYNFFGRTVNTSFNIPDGTQVYRMSREVVVPA